MIINHNISAMNTHRQLTGTTGSLSKSSEKLSSGYRINRAGDDAAGLTISEKMRNQIKGLQQASTNAQDGISLIQTAEGALTEVHEILKTMRQKVVDYGNGTKTADDRNAIFSQLQQSIQEIDRIATTTEFNTMKLFTGKYSAAATEMKLQIGANGGQTMGVVVGNMRAFKLGITNSTATVANGFSILMVSANTATGLDMTSTTTGTQIASAVDKTLSRLDTAIKKVSSQRSTLGAYQNRLENTINNLNVSAENLQAAESRIRDVDMAKEIMEHQKNNILLQASQSMLAQANQAPQGVLSLLR
ncbi:MAG: flagellin [Clostridiales bacterium]|jgi:flagellin|nr:flagellin [Clostridiales bacterium]